MSTETRNDNPIQWHTIAAIAQELHLSPKSLYRHRKRLAQKDRTMSPNGDMSEEHRKKLVAYVLKVTRKRIAC